MTDAALVLFASESGPWLMAVASAAVTLLHTLDEVEAPGGPVWAYLGRVYGVRVPAAGLFLFAAAQVGLAAAGYVLGFAPALWLLVGVRLADCVVSHWGPWLAGRRPNPGLATTPLYAAEAALFALHPFA